MQRRQSDGEAMRAFAKSSTRLVASWTKRHRHRWSLQHCARPHPSAGITNLHSRTPKGWLHAARLPPQGMAALNPEMPRTEVADQYPGRMHTVRSTKHYSDNVAEFGTAAERTRIKTRDDLHALRCHS
ncbi:hypothetical protein IOCL2690_000062600 [Leishmania lindenbergi]|uniref:Uncharacterized protein n=1 Tax=Leishmania lindenbergi TaxID=651832 RepID=A0AAW3AY71_9TRYP